MTRITFFAEGEERLTSSERHSAQSRFVRRSVTFTSRFPGSGSHARKRFRTPSLSYSKSEHAVSPGFIGKGLRVSLRSCLLLSSIPTTGSSSFSGRFYTQRTSSISHTHAALHLGGIHHCFFCHGFNAFFERPSHCFVAPILERLPFNPFLG